MAAIVLTAAASSAASALGAGTFLAGIAGAAGGYLGGFIDRSIFGGKARINQEGPRLNDLMVQASTYGKVIPLVYGRARIAGNVLWARPIEEHLTSAPQASGRGKWGGPSESDRNEYTYTVSLAIALCEGPIQGVLRAWADAKLIELTLDNHTLYLGAEDQLPDTFMSSFHAPGQTPAYRGLAYIVLKNFPLGEFGNRIPNFTFEVNRILKKAYDLEDKIKEITLIPGAGEYVYDTHIQEKMSGELDVTGNFIQGGKATKLNQNTHHNKADVLVALDHLKATLPNVTWVSVVINWFANSLDPSLCEIKPGVEFKDQGSRITPDEWAVGSFTRQNAHAILKFPNNAPTYGGTPTDLSILRLCQELKKRGYKVMLYPMLQVDILNPPKPWRGRITPTNSKEVTQFFNRTHGYNDFILHYATLNIGGVWLKNNIDAFMIGSELVGLTTHMSKAGVFPAVTELKSLAATIKLAVGSSVKVSYGGDWSEYHSVNGWYHLDPLWSDPNIDMVALDCYFPLTPDLPQSQIDAQKIYDGWTKGEGWEYYYSDPNRQNKVPYSAPNYAWKNVKHWWNSKHINPDGSSTAWQPKMKPIWFSELGFPSVDGCSNQPNVFVDPTSVESFYPRGSRRRVDFSAQRLALEASLDYLEAQNKMEAHFIPKKFIWAWDARPFPHFPDLLSVWIDGTNWNTGHWIQGKLGASNLGQIVAHLLAKVGYEANMVDTSRLTDSVSGFVVTHRQSVRACLEQLASSYFFDMVESDGLLKFIKRGKISSSLFAPPRNIASASHSIDFNELVSREEASDTFLITRTQELELPRQVDVIYLNQKADYQAGTQSSQRQTVKAVDYATINLPLVLNDEEAKTIADVTLCTAWVGRVQYQFTLPPKYALLEPSDVVELTKEAEAMFQRGAKAKDASTHLMRITSTKLMRNGLQEITAVAEDISSYDFYTPPTPPTSPLKKPAHTSPTRLELLDLPAFPTDSATEAYLRTAIVGVGESTRGAILYRSNDGGENYAFLQRLSTEAIIGTALNILPPGSGASWDRNAHIDVLLISGQLESVSELAVLNGANVCLLGEEVLQFQTATLLNTNKYRVSCLLRGRLGTEWAVRSHSAGERFLLLTPALGQELMPSSTWGMAKKYKPVTICHTLSATQEQDFTYCARALKPYAPVHIVGSRNKAGDLTLSWKRRTRIGGEWRDGVDVPLAEEKESYEVDILQGTMLKRTLTGLTAPTVVYTSVQQVTDFGSMQSRITVNVYQLSASVGRGYPGNATL